MITVADILQARILIVDDQAANVSLLEHMLRGAGYVSIESTTHPNEVCQLHRKNRYALILLDLEMPGLDGFHVMEGLKEIEPDGYLPVLVLTAQPGHKLRALKAGAKDFVSKPFDLAEVLTRVYNLIEVRLLHLKMKAQFIGAQKMEAVGQLASGVAHDFNNILMVIRGYNDMITSGLAPDSPLRKHAEEIRHAAERASGLTQQLLVFSRKQAVQLVVLDLNDTVNELEEMLRRLMDENINMLLVPEKEIGHVSADSGYVGQVLMNLVINARDAMPNGGQLTIATNNVTLNQHSARAHKGMLPGDYVLLSVSDTGTGMTNQVKAQMFEAFFTTKPTGKGTGLGLATCQTIVQQLGGYIGADSEVGKGTTFQVYFPRVEQPLDIAARTRQTGPLPRGTETLLVVEDEPSVRHLTCCALEAQGYQVLHASNGQDALDVVREHKGSPIRVVITDVIMPLMDGKVMADRLKTTHPDIKILFISGYTDSAITHHGGLDTRVEFLPKPYTTATLARKVRERLDNGSAFQPDAEKGIPGANATTA